MKTSPVHVTILFLLLASLVADGAPAADYHAWAPTPPMGWNSWDCFGTTITEAQTKAQTDFMAEKLKAHGWQYIVVDIQWYQPTAKGHGYEKDAKLTMDEFGRLVPAPEKFPSAAGGNGFKPLADYVHSKGLKFGIHMMRGIPRQAVRQNTPIKGSTVHAADIADTASICRWNTDMYGVDMSKPGAQAYYDSLHGTGRRVGRGLRQGGRPEPPLYHQGRDRGHPPGHRQDRTSHRLQHLAGRDAALRRSATSANNANLWRISDDFWDSWKALQAQFKRLHDWTPYRLPGAWPDADMLPLGIVKFTRKTHFTPDEQITLMTLWCIARSPLMHGGDLTKTDDFTLSLLTNDEVLAVDQGSANNRQLFRTDDGLIAWIADAPGSADKYLAVFNTRDAAKDLPPGATAPVPVKLADLGINGSAKVRDLWMKKDLDPVTGEFAPEVPFHGARFFRVHPTP